MFDFFQRKICLTLQPEEWAKAQAEFSRVGLSGVEKFQALPIDDKEILGPHQSFNGSVNRILHEFHESGKDSLLFLEDDCVFKDLSHLKTALNELPPDWDILYLGANLLLWNTGEEPKPERYSSHLFRVRAAWTTHAIAFRRKVAPFILENQPQVSARMVDNWLSDQLPNLNAYIVAPMVAWQRPHVSSIWGRYDDYGPIFEASDARLK